MDAKIELAKKIAEELKASPGNEKVDSPWYCIAVSCLPIN
jgi:hypothetical protein